jgi:uncharacterized protein YidB (DUF937 family)
VSGTEAEQETVTPEGEQAGDQSVESAEGETDGKAEAEGAPEKYDWDLGEGVEVDAELAGEFEPVARELGLSNDQANKLASEMLPKVQQQMTANWAKQVDGWRQQSESDPEFGGAKLEATMGEARKALEAHGSKELNELLENTGIGNHPALIRAFASMGRSLKEDQLVTNGGKPTSGPKDLTEAFYPKSKQ